MSVKADTEILQRSVIPAGRIIFHANDIGTTAFLINKGTVEIYREEDGREASIAMLDAGEMFGEMALFNDGRRCTCARAHTAVELTAIQGWQLERLMARAEPGLKGIVRMLVKRIADINHRIEVCPQTNRFRVKGDQDSVSRPGP